MKVEVVPDADAVAARGAAVIAATAREAVRSRGRFTCAFSGGRTPWQMLRRLAREDLPWEAVSIFQVDERVAADGDPARNLTHLTQSLCALPPQRRPTVYPMPVQAVDLDEAARAYAQTIRSVAGPAAVLDMVHLGVGADGHVASLFPADAALALTDADVALAGPYLGHRRMTLTLPIVNRARTVLWLVTGEDKHAALARLVAADATIPAGCVDRRNAWLIADRAAMGHCPAEEQAPC